MRLFTVAAGVVLLCGVALTAGVASYVSQRPGVDARVPPASSLPQPAQSSAPQPVLPIPEDPAPVAAAAVAPAPPAAPPQLGRSHPPRHRPPG